MREEKENEMKRRKKVEIHEKEEQLMINSNEAKLMNEENWIETTKMWKSLKKTDEEICKIGKGKDCQIGNAGDNRRGMKSRNKRKEGKERG